MANLSGASTLHVSVGLLTNTARKSNNDQIKAAKADNGTGGDGKSVAAGKIKQRSAQAALASYAVSMAVNAGLDVADYYISDIGRRNGDSNYQTEINRVCNNTSRAINMVTSTVTSAATGFSVGGPVGAIVMGAVTAISQGIGYGMEIQRQNRAYAHEMFKDSQRTEILKQRASLVDYNGRVR